VRDVATVMYTIRLAPEDASVGKVKARLGLGDDEIDEGFGVVNIDPEKSLYTILVDERAAEKLAGEEAVEGPFSNPRIETFGPPS
jgi:hypothetical protein